MRIFIMFLKKYYKNILPYIILAALSEILSIYIINTTGNISNLILQKNNSGLIQSSVKLIFTVAASIMLVPLFQLYQMKNFIYLGFSFDSWFYSRFIRNEKKVIDRYEKGVLCNRLFMDPILYRGDIIQILGTSVIFLIVFGICFLILVKINFVLTIICILISLTPAVLSYNIKNIIKKMDKENRERMNNTQSLGKSIIDNYLFIKAQCLEIKLIKHIKKDYDLYIKFIKKRLTLEKFLSNFNEFYDLICSIAIYIFGGIFIAKNIITLGDGIKFLGISFILKENVINLNASLKSFFSLNISTQRVNELIKSEKMGDMEIEIIKSIKIKGLKFSYNNQKIFDGLDFFIGTGEHLIIKGDNGSGKTTLSKLITGLYKDYDGIITINDIDLKKINLYSLRKQIFICEQFPLIFNTSVYENIEYFVSKEQEHRIDDIISILSLDDIKYKQTGENGKFLSGGQIQKISIARAMLSGAALIILDEPDTALDTETHNKVMNYFNNLKIMLIIISHNDNWSVPKTSKVINL